VSVFNCNLVQTSVVNAQPHAAVFLLHEED
jgi:hypothetical protein